MARFWNLLDSIVPVRKSMADPLKRRRIYVIIALALACWLPILGVLWLLLWR